MTMATPTPYKTPKPKYKNTIVHSFLPLKIMKKGEYNE